MGLSLCVLCVLNQGSLSSLCHITLTASLCYVAILPWVEDYSALTVNVLRVLATSTYALDAIDMQRKLCIGE